MPAGTTSPIRHAGRPRPASVAMARSAASAGTTATMPIPPFSVARASGPSIPARASTTWMTDGTGQASGATPAPPSAGSARGPVPARPPAEPPPPHVEVGPVECRVVVGEGRAHERVAVGVQPRRGHADERVAGARGAAVQELVALHDPDAEAGQVELVGPPQAGMLGGLATDERTAGQFA